MINHIIMRVVEEKASEFDNAVEEYQVFPSQRIKTENEIDYIFTTFTQLEDSRMRYLMEATLTYLYPMAAIAKERNLSQLKLVEGKTISAYELIRAYVGKVLAADKSGNAARVIKSYCQDVGLNMINNRPAIRFLSNINHDEILSDSIKNGSSLIEHAKKSSQVTYNFSIHEEDLKMNLENHVSLTKTGKRKPNKFKSLSEKLKTQRGSRGINMDEVTCNCQLLGNYLKGQRPIEEHELYVLQTALAKVDSGKVLHEKLLENARLSISQKHSFRFQFEIIRLSNLNPVSCIDKECDFVCSYEDKCNHKVNLLQQTKANRGEVRYLGELNCEKGINEVCLQFTEELKKIYEANDKNVHVLKAPTGLGKTEAMLRLKLNNVAIALPTHRLCKEVHKRLTAAGHNFLLVSERPLLPDKLEHEYESLQSMGLYKRASKIVFKYAETLKKKDLELLNEDDCNLINYAKTLESMKTATKIIVTHQRLLQLNNKNIKTYIIDEDILLSSMIKTLTISEHNLINVLMSGDNNELDEDRSFVDVFLQFLNLPEGNFYTKDVTSIREKIEEYLLSKIGYIDDNVIDFLDSQYYLSTKNKVGEKFIHTTKIIPLDEKVEKKLIIMSATANKIIYERVFKKRLKFIDIGQTVIQGRIMWHPDKSFSRANFVKHINDSDIPDRFGDTNVISYKKYRDLLTEKGLKVIATFGSTAGLDMFKGKDLVVIGSPYTYRQVYLLIGKTLGFEISDEDLLLENYSFCPVTRHGYDFSCVTFKQNKGLQEVQFALIESELIQAVGRARTLRYNCRVDVYSRIPVPGAQIT